MVTLYFGALILASLVAGIHLSSPRLYPSTARRDSVIDSSTTAFHQGVRNWNECAELCDTAANIDSYDTSAACLVGCAADGMNAFFYTYTYTANGLTADGNFQWKSGYQHEIRNDTTAFQTCDDWCGRPADYWYEKTSPSNGNVMKQGMKWYFTQSFTSLDSCYTAAGYTAAIILRSGASTYKDSEPTYPWDAGNRDVGNPATLSAFLEGGQDDCLIGCKARNLLEPADLSCAAGESETLIAIDEDPWVDIECETILCLEDEYVSNNECAPCAGNSTNPAGDDATGSDTTCGDEYSPASSIQANAFLIGVCAFLFKML